jgi:hypothetical protein
MDGDSGQACRRLAEDGLSVGAERRWVVSVGRGRGLALGLAEASAG